MSHLHIPDGVIGAGWCLAGFVVTFILMFFFFSRLKKGFGRKIPLTGVAGAIMLLAMSVPLGLLPLHLGLAALCGILLGPALGFLAVFVVNVVLAFVGHGGITVVGINTLIVGAEALLGACFFRAAQRKMKAAKGAALATALALLISTTLMLATVGAAAGVQELASLFQHKHYLHEEELEEDRSEFFQAHEEGRAPGPETAMAGVHFLRYTGLSALLLALLTGIALETAATALIVHYLAKVRPDYLFGQESS